MKIIAIKNELGITYEARIKSKITLKERLQA